MILNARITFTPEEASVQARARTMLAGLGLRFREGVDEGGSRTFILLEETIEEPVLIALLIALRSGPPV